MRRSGQHSGFPNRLRRVELKVRLGRGNQFGFVIGELDTPSLSAADGFDSDLILRSTFYRPDPDHATLKAALTVLDGHGLAGFQQVANRSQTRSKRSDVEGVSQFVERVVRQIF